MRNLVMVVVVVVVVTMVALVKVVVVVPDQRTKADTRNLMFFLVFDL